MGPMLRWFIFTIAMGLLPFGFSGMLQTLRGVPPEEWQNSPELLFFSVMVSASQLGGIFDTLMHSRRYGRRQHVLLSFAFGFFLLAAILSSGLYGVYVDHERSARACQSASAAITVDQAVDPGYCTEWLDFQTNLYNFSIVVAGIVGSFGTVTEWVRTRRQG